MIAGKPTTPEEYLASVPEQTRASLDEVRDAVREALPDAHETIGYGILAYRLGGRVLCYCAGWAAHVIEQSEHNRLIRPRARYTGPAVRPVRPLAERD